MTTIKIEVSTKDYYRWKWLLEKRYGKKKIENLCRLAILEAILDEAEKVIESTKEKTSK